MSNDEQFDALTENPLRDLIEYYKRQAEDVIDPTEHKRYLATAFYLKAYQNLPF